MLKFSTFLLYYSPYNGKKGNYIYDLERKYNMDHNKNKYEDSNLNAQDIEELKKLIKDNPLYIRNLEEPSEELKALAVSRKGSVIQYIKNPSEELQLLAVKNDPMSVEYIHEPWEQVAILAVKGNWNALKYIKNPVEAVIKAAIEEKGWAIQYIKDPTNEQQLLAIEKDYDAVRYIAFPTIEAQILAVSKYWGAIRYIKEPFLETKLKALEGSAEAIMYINSYNEEELGAFIKKNINVLKYLYDSVEVQWAVELIKEKIQENQVDPVYIKNYMELEILEMDKLAFIRDFGSKSAKKIVVDYCLSL